jgi:hypothetical protein
LLAWIHWAGGFGSAVDRAVDAGNDSFYGGSSVDRRVLRGLIALLEAKSLYFNGSFESVMLWRTSGSVLALFDR